MIFLSVLAKYLSSLSFLPYANGVSIVKQINHDIEFEFVFLLTT